MGGLLLETKLHVPRRSRGFVVRPRLRARLDAAAESALTLVSAPAGFGKTTLLAEWLSTALMGGRLGAWVSLDQRDNDPGRFFSYVIAALRRAVKDIGAEALSLLQPPQAPTEAALGALLNELGHLADDVVLVLDDFHVIESKEVRDGLAFLLEHLPEQLHLVVATRADPDLPLARLRAGGELAEIRAADLRFSLEECTAYLNDMMDLDLAPVDVAALEDRTEGWVAALQLAALSLQGREDRAGFIAGFAGDDRYVVDYLVQEVLQRQSEQVRSFLLHTCILDRLNASLCDAVTGRHDAKATLIALEHDNLFVVPLDDRRRSYRYHHLFADVLHAHLLDEQPDIVAELHHRASVWYDRNAEPLEAIRHAVIGEDLDRAADLMERAIPALRRSRREAVIRTWLDVLPADLIRARPVLRIGLVGALAASGELADIEPHLQDVERWLDGGPEGAAPQPTAEMVVVDWEEFARLPAEIAMYRAAQALVAGDIDRTVDHARSAVHLSPAGDQLPRAGATALLGLAAWTRGNLPDAQQAYTDAMGMLERTGHDADVLGCATGIADLQIAQGRLRDAMRTCERALTRVAGDLEAVRGTADLHVSLSEVHLERGDLHAATQHLLTSKALDEHAGLPRNRHRCRIAMARLREAQGRLDEALDYLDRAERVYTADFFPEVRPIAAWRARVHLKQGRLDDALGWVRQRGLTPDDDPDYLSEFEHLTLARALLASSGRDDPNRSSVDEALGLLARLLTAAEGADRTGSVLEILVLLAVAYQKRLDKVAAAEHLWRALAIAEPEGFVRVFVEQGQALAALLRVASKQQGHHRFAQHLLAALDGTTPVGPVGGVLIDPLSERELDVLRLLTTDLDGPDIARELVVSLNTIRTHTKHIYAKLGVNNRRAAVRRAQELELLARVR